jgi:hypothetical protein
LFDGQRRYFLSTSGPTIIGQKACAIMLSSPGVALQHARLTPGRSGFTVETAGGEVLVNGQLIAAPTLLKPGDTLKIGESTLTYEGPAVSSAPEQKLSYDELFEKVKGAVVGIHTATGLGSGFFVHPSGLLATNRHVVGYERAVSVQLADGKQVPGRVVRSFPELDLAFVRLDSPAPFTPPFAPPGLIRVGQAVLVIGHPRGLSNTLTRGIISAVNREVMGNTYLQTDAAINPGNSGGPIFNELGEIVGMAAMGIGQSQGLNFAIPADLVRRRSEQFLAEEKRVAQGQGVYCFVCGYFGIGGAYCPNCGVGLERPTTPQAAAPAGPAPCKNCGKSLNPGDLFCPACGTRV